MYLFIFPHISGFHYQQPSTTSAAPSTHRRSFLHSCDGPFFSSSLPATPPYSEPRYRGGGWAGALSQPGRGHNLPTRERGRGWGRRRDGGRPDCWRHESAGELLWQSARQSSWSPDDDITDSSGSSQSSDDIITPPLPRPCTSHRPPILPFPMPLPITQPRSVRLGRSWGRGSSVQTPGVTCPVLPQQQWRRRSRCNWAAAGTSATTLPPSPSLPHAERFAAPRTLAQVLRPSAAGPYRLRSLSYPAASGNAARPARPAPSLQHRLGLHHSSSAVPALSAHPYYSAQTLPLPPCVDNTARGRRRQTPALHLSLSASPTRPQPQPRHAHTLPPKPLPVRLHPLHLLHSTSANAVGTTGHAGNATVLYSPVSAPLLHPAASSTFTLASPYHCATLPTSRGSWSGPKAKTSEQDQHGRLRIRQRPRTVMCYPAGSHRGALLRRNRRGKRCARAEGERGEGRGGQLQGFQNGCLFRRRALRAGKRKLLSLCYFHLHFPHR